MAKAKQTAYVLTDEGADSVGSDEGQTFGTVPGVWVRGVPVLLADLDPTLEESDFKRMVKEANAPIVSVKVDADYSPKRGRSQLELRQKGGVPHLPSGRPMTADEADMDAFADRRRDELQPVAEASLVEDAAEKNKTELLESIEEQQEGPK